jgi:5-carboxyvanillate decarboxylase
MPTVDLPRIIAELVDLDTERLADMDRTGVSMQVFSLTAPGVQEFDADTAVELARLANDRAAEVVKRHPDRFAALCAFAPQDTRHAVTEMERGIRSLRFNGFIVNSHTNNEYLDLPKFWPILEAAEALDRAVYIHPRSPADTMAKPMADYGMGGALWGYGVEAGTHAVRLMMSGVLDRFPKIKIVLGHMGEALPFWLARLDANACRAMVLHGTIN